MSPASWLCHPAQATRHSQEEPQALLARAKALRHESLLRQRPLLGKRLGLMSASPDSADALLFQEAAHALGAHVAQIRAPTDSLDEGHNHLRDIGRLLGRLYDAVECQGLGEEQVRDLAAVATIPVYAGLACHGNTLFQLAKAWRTSAPLIQRRRWLVQAALLTTLMT